MGTGISWNASRYLKHLLRDAGENLEVEADRHVFDVQGAIVVGALNLGGSIDPVPNAVQIAELAIDKQAQSLLMPVAARRQLDDLPDDLWTRISIEFYKDATDAVFKALME